MNDKPISVDDVIRAGGCATGIRDWFEANLKALPGWYISPGKGIDFPVETTPLRIAVRRFSEQGMPLEIALTLNDGIIDRILETREALNGG